jgi:hypothetical protein
MSFDTLLIHQVTIRRMVEPAERDAHGDLILAHDPALDVTTNARVEPTTGTESLSNRELERETFEVFLPPNSVVAGTDELHWLDRDVILKVEGPPLECSDSIGVHHIELMAYIKTG